MELGKIIFSNHINQRFEELVFILHFNDYFSYQSNAIDYVDKIYDFINTDIYTFPNKITPKELLHLGSKYIFYRPNQRTTWYIFFQQSNNNYLITGILNNHCEESAFI